MKRLSVLLIAYQCAPGQGSVSQIGWEWFSRLRAVHAVTLVTHVRNRAALEAAGAGEGVRYVDTEWLAGPLYRLARWAFPRSEHAACTLASLDYFAFDLAACWQLRRARRAGASWQVAHRVTPVTMSAPTWCTRLGVPLMAGPLNCGLGMPRGFGQALRQDSSWTARLRVGPALLDALMGSSARINRFLTATRATLAAVAPRHRARCYPMLENGVNEAVFAAQPWPAPPDGVGPLRVLFVGRLIPVKGLPMLLSALAQLRLAGLRVELDVVGDGPMAALWRAHAGECGVGDAVRFHGALPALEVARHLAACHVLCLPSVRESGGAVLLEAMACARPVIALAYGGPAEIVTPEVGALLPMHSPEQVTSDLAATLRDICRAPAAWQARGQAARRRMEREFGWPAKIEQATRHYLELIEEGAPHA